MNLGARVTVDGRPAKVVATFGSGRILVQYTDGVRALIDPADRQITEVTG